jgi:hypothetical protein
MLAEHFGMILERECAFLDALLNFVGHGGQGTAADFGLNVDPP